MLLSQMRDAIAHLLHAPVFMRCPVFVLRIAGLRPPDAAHAVQHIHDAAGRACGAAARVASLSRIRALIRTHARTVSQAAHAGTTCLAAKPGKCQKNTG